MFYLDKLCLYCLFIYNNLESIFLVESNVNGIKVESKVKSKFFIIVLFLISRSESEINIYIYIYIYIFEYII